jgi:hypothetical protein
MSPTRVPPSILALSFAALALAGCASTEGNEVPASAADELNDPTDTSESSTEEFAITGSAACPKVVKAGIRGDSFILGIKKTFDIKGFIAPGQTLSLTRTAEGDNIHLVYRAPLAPAFASCVGKSAVRTMFNDDSTQVIVFENRTITLDVVLSPSLILDLTSTFANQAIFKVFEAG